MPARRDGACAAPFFRQYLRYGTGGLWSCSCACLAAMKLPAFSFPRFGRRQPRRTDRADGLSSPRQTIAVVGSPDLRPPLEDVVGPGAYDVVFIESMEDAHARIAQARPDRVILCCDVDDPSGFQLLTMLKADCRTRTIPATTFVIWPLLNPVEMM